MESLEKSLERKESISEKIAGAKSWAELESILDNVGRIAGSERKKLIGDEIRPTRKEYSAEDLKRRIEEIRDGGFVDSITRTEGLRDKVSELLVHDAEDFTDLKNKLMQVKTLRSDNINGTPFEEILEMLDVAQKTGNVEHVSQLGNIRLGDKAKTLLIKEALAA